MTQLDKSQWQRLIPHHGAMCLLDAVINWDATHLQARAVSHRDPANPLRARGGLHAVHLCEYAAQAIALHGGLCAQQAGHAAPLGFLVSLHSVKLHVTAIDGLRGDLDVHVEQLLDGAAGCHYAFRVASDGCPLAEGRVAVMHGRSG